MSAQRPPPTVVLRLALLHLAGVVVDGRREDHRLPDAVGGQVDDAVVDRRRRPERPALRDRRRGATGAAAATPRRPAGAAAAATRRAAAATGRAAAATSGAGRTRGRAARAAATRPSRASGAARSGRARRTAARAGRAGRAATLAARAAGVVAAARGDREGQGEGQEARLHELAKHLGSAPLLAVAEVTGLAAAAVAVAVRAGGAGRDARPEFFERAAAGIRDVGLRLHRTEDAVVVAGHLHRALGNDARKRLKLDVVERRRVHGAEGRAQELRGGRAGRRSGGVDLGEEVLGTPDAVVAVADILAVLGVAARVRVVGLVLVELLERDRVQRRPVQVEQIARDEADRL